MRALFLAPLIALAVAANCVQAQQNERPHRIGVLANGRAAQFEELLRRGLSNLGWTEGRNIAIEWRESAGRNEQLPALAAELVRSRPDVIIAAGTPATVAAKSATGTIPIVFTVVGDPVAMGIVASLARPEGNLTGTSMAGAAIGGRHVQYLKEAIPGLSRVAVLVNSTFAPDRAARHEFDIAARRLGIVLTPIEVQSPEALDGAFAAMAREKLSAALVVGQPMMFTLRSRLARLAIEHRVATVVPWSEAVDAGLFMSYGELVADHWRRVPYFVDRILRGARPAELSVEQPTRFYLAINLKTAKSIGVAVSTALRLQADRLIEE